MDFDPKEAEQLLIKDRNKYLRYVAKLIKEAIKEKEYDSVEVYILEASVNLNSMVGAIDYFRNVNRMCSLPGRPIYPRIEPIFYEPEDDEEE